MKKWALLGLLAGMLAVGAPTVACAQAAEGGGEAGTTEAAAKKAKRKTNDFMAVLTGSGFLGVLIWIGLFGAGGAGIYFMVDGGITVKQKRIMPQALVDNVTQAMAEGDVMKALQFCESEPGPLSNVLSAGFSHVEEGFEVIQEAVGTAADLETEKIMQKLTWITVCANLAPMLGLMGTVQGMIVAFGTLAEGAPDVGMLALAIAQALYTTFAGLSVAIPCVAVYYNLRNQANRTFLKMEALTMELIKDLRNVEVVEN